MLAWSVVLAGTAQLLGQNLVWGEPLPVKRFVLPSGQQVYIQENHAQPIVTVDTWVETGSVNESADNNGVSHFLEHLIFKGTPSHPPGSIDRLLESKGAHFNAATSQDFTHYYITTAASFFEEALRVHADMLQNANLPQPDLDRERKVVQEEINRAEDNPQHKLFRTLSRELFPGHGYALETLGPKALIGSIPREKILAYYHTWYQPKNFRTVIVGDVSTEEALRLVEREFAAKEAPTPAAGYNLKPKFPDNGPKSVVMADPNVSQTYGILAFPAPGLEENRQDNYALDIAMQILGSGQSSRLYRQLREEEKLVNDISAGNMTQRLAGTLYVSFETSPDKQQQALASLTKSLGRIQAEGVTADELRKAKTQAIKSFVFHTESTEGVAESIGYNVTIGRLEDYTDYVANLQKVTAEDVQRVLRQYLDYRKSVFVAVTPPEAATPRINAEAAAPLQSTPPAFQAQAATILKQAAQPVPNAPMQQTAQRATTEAGQNPAIHRAVLPSGATLLVKPLSSADTVTLKVFVRGGQRVESMPGVAELMAELMTQGTRTRTASALHQELESRGMQLTAQAQPDYLEITASAVKEDIGELFLILQDVLQNATFPADELAKEKTFLRQSLQANRDNPSSLVFEELNLAMYPKNHPYGNIGPRVEQSLDKISREHLLRYYRRWVTPREMVISVVGNVSPELMTQYWNSAWKTPANAASRPKASPMPSAPLPARAKTETQTQSKPRQAATWIAQGWYAPSVGSPDYTPLKVLNSLLGTGMSSRLFVNLREQQGLAYVVSSFYPSRAETGQFVIYIGTDPKNQSAVLSGFQQQIQRLIEGDITERELQEAKDKLRGNFALAHETPAAQATYLGMFETLGVGYRFDTEYPKQIESVTLADLQRVARRYFSKPSVISIIAPAGPAASKADAANGAEASHGQ
jgi:zinc protease